MTVDLNRLRIEFFKWIKRVRSQAQKFTSHREFLAEFLDNEKLVIEFDLARAESDMRDLLWSLLILRERLEEQKLRGVMIS